MVIIKIENKIIFPGNFGQSASNTLIPTINPLIYYPYGGPINMNMGMNMNSNNMNMFYGIPPNQIGNIYNTSENIHSNNKIKIGNMDNTVTTYSNINNNNGNKNNSQIKNPK